jgi:hypothetical protein
MSPRRRWHGKLSVVPQHRCKNLMVHDGLFSNELSEATSAGLRRKSPALPSHDLQEEVSYGY